MDVKKNDNLFFHIMWGVGIIQLLEYEVVIRKVSKNIYILGTEQGNQNQKGGSYELSMEWSLKFSKKQPYKGL